MNTHQPSIFGLSLPALLAGSVLTLAAAHQPAAAAGFVLAATGCAMAHCDSRMSDGAGTTSPAAIGWSHVDRTPIGGSGLGCVSNLSTVACTYRNDPRSNLAVYDASGNRVWEDYGQLGSNAWMSVPFIGADGTIVAADENWVMRVDPATNTVLWKSAKVDTGLPINPVPIGSNRGMVFIATNTNSAGGTAEVSVWDVTTGALLSHQPIRDPATGRIYVTRNTVAVSGNRAYVLTNADGDPSDGRLYAIDVCGASDCGGRGTQTVSWHYDFKGPSGSSPLLIGKVLYFDGKPTKTSGSFMAVADHGTSASLLWTRSFHGTFNVSAAQDPRGGLWVHTWTGAEQLTRLNANTGNTAQQIVVSTALGLPSGYTANSVMTVGSSPTGAVLLTVGVYNPGIDGVPSYVAAIDVSSTPGGSAFWLYQIAPSASANTVTGQFPIVVDPNGARRVVFNGSKSSTFFIGEP
jgi:hypothetical protein